MTAYNYQPEMIYRIKPAPQYPDNHFAVPTKNVLFERQAEKETFERLRHSNFTKIRQQARASTGRLHAHITIEETKKQIQHIHDLETGAKSARHRQPQTVASLPEFEYEEKDFLPFGMGYDKMIKERAELIDKEKFLNNKMMDELVLKLGYMDYRDALACNKYILEAKRSKDYHQLTRAKILAAAMTKYNQQRKDEIEKKLRSDLSLRKKSNEE